MILFVSATIMIKNVIEKIVFIKIIAIDDNVWKDGLSRKGGKLL
jgi:hypothetical protein